MDGGKGETFYILYFKRTKVFFFFMVSDFICSLKNLYQV